MHDDDLLKRIAKNIQNARLNKGLTQEKFAEKIDKSWSYVSKIESGKTNLTLKTINALAKELDIQVSDILRTD